MQAGWDLIRNVHFRISNPTELVPVLNYSFFRIFYNFLRFGLIVKKNCT